MQRKQGSRRSSHAPRLVLLLLLFALVLPAGRCCSCRGCKKFFVKFRIFS